MFEFAIEHQFWIAVVIYWIFSAAVSSMPVPSSNTGAGYLWVFRFLHTLAGNVTTVFGRSIPGASTVAALAATALLLTSSGCAAHYSVHPASLSTDDSAAYDALPIAQGTIDQAR